jgi:hypothetical protein
MRPARPPGGPAPLGRTRLPPGCALGFRRLPDPAAREPFHHDVGIRAAQLVERRQQIVRGSCPERRWLLIDEDRPVRVPRRHDVIVCVARPARFQQSGIRMSFVRSLNPSWWKGKRVLVTGADGFIGLRVISWLIE